MGEEDQKKKMKQKERERKNHFGQIHRKKGDASMQRDWETSGRNSSSHVFEPSRQGLPKYRQPRAISVEDGKREKELEGDAGDGEGLFYKEMREGRL